MPVKFYITEDMGVVLDYGHFGRVDFATLSSETERVRREVGSPNP